MKINNKFPGYRNPKDGIEKMFVLIALLNGPMARHLDDLARVLEKSERQTHRDIRTIANFYTVKQDYHGRYLIAA